MEAEPAKDEKPYEPEAAAAEAAPEPEAAPPADDEKPSWTEAEVKKMTVSQLKEALTDLGLPTDGLKAVLKDRLLEAI